MTDATVKKDAAAINKELLEAVFLINRIAHRAMSAEERVGQRIQGNPRGEIEGLLVQMAAIENLARSALPKEAREVLN